MTEIENKPSPLAYVAWTQALVATSGSLYFSEVAGYLPCLLCWYQRIAMYPLVIILAVGILRRDAKVYQYVLPLAIAGALVALYHVLLYYKVFPESEQTCRAGVSCTTEYIEWFGFVTIPLLSLGAFLVIIGCMVLLWKKSRK
ncbi:MAG TPA: disulfide oxidoreductase [Patescibacteria group bacterium]